MARKRTLFIVGGSTFGAAIVAAALILVQNVMAKDGTDQGNSKKPEHAPAVVVDKRATVKANDDSKVAIDFGVVVEGRPDGPAQVEVVVTFAGNRKDGDPTGPRPIFNETLTVGDSRQTGYGGTWETEPGFKYKDIQVDLRPVDGGEHSSVEPSTVAVTDLDLEESKDEKWIRTELDSSYESALEFPYVTAVYFDEAGEIVGGEGIDNHENPERGILRGAYMDPYDVTPGARSYKVRANNIPDDADVKQTKIFVEPRFE